jgi:hypothetical protein
MVFFGRGENTMRRVPSVDPEQLRAVCQRKAAMNPVAYDALAFGFSRDVVFREMELRRFGLRFACVLPGVLQRLVFKLAATVPLQSTFPEFDEAVRNGNSTATFGRSV